MRIGSTLGVLVGLGGCALIGCNESQPVRADASKGARDTSVPKIDARVVSPDLGGATGDAAPPLRQWVVVDSHVHAYFPDEKPQPPATIIKEMTAVGVDFSWVMLFGRFDLKDPKRQALVTGRDHPASTGAAKIRFGVEISGANIPAALNGHLTLPLLEPLSWVHLPTLASGTEIVDWAAKQTPPVPVAMAHGQSWPADGACCSINDLPVHVARGRIAFLETNEYVNDKSPDPRIMRAGISYVWARLLDSGFQLPLVGGSDTVATAAVFGAVNTHVLVKGPPTFEAVVRAAAGGATSVSNFPDNRLTMTVDGRDIGSVVDLAAAGSVDVVIESKVHLPDTVEVIVNRRTVKRIAVKPGSQIVKHKLALASSSWIAVRTKHAMTSSIFVRVAGKPVRPDAESACYFVELLKEMRRDTLVTGKRFAAFLEAEAIFVKRAQEAGAPSCR